MKKQNPHKEDFQILADLFKLLSDPTRLQIFWTLCHGEECVIHLASILNISCPALSHHLKQLKDSNLIIGRRDGKEVYYTAADTIETQTLHQALEEIMQVSCPKWQEALCQNHGHANLSSKDQVFHEVHQYLLDHLSERITIESLARLFLMNTTTLKNGFKALYGTSIAAHIKIHRMEKAARLLSDGRLAVSEIAKAVGYTSQSKFSAAFYEKYHLLPSEYRKSHTK